MTSPTTSRRYSCTGLLPITVLMLCISLACNNTSVACPPVLQPLQAVFASALDQLMHSSGIAWTAAHWLLALVAHQFALHGTGPAATSVHGCSRIVPDYCVSCLLILGLLQAAANLHCYRVVGMACQIVFLHLGLC